MYIVTNAIEMKSRAFRLIIVVLFFFYRMYTLHHDTNLVHKYTIALSTCESCMYTHISKYYY